MRGVSQAILAHLGMGVDCVIAHVRDALQTWRTPRATASRCGAGDDAMLRCRGLTYTACRFQNCLPKSRSTTMTRMYVLQTPKHAIHMRDGKMTANNEAIMPCDDAMQVQQQRAHTHKKESIAEDSLAAPGLPRATGGVTVPEHSSNDRRRISVTQEAAHEHVSSLTEQGGERFGAGAQHFVPHQRHAQGRGAGQRRGLAVMQCTQHMHGMLL